MRNQFVVFSSIVLISILVLLYFHTGWHSYVLLGVVLIPISIGGYDLFQHEDNIRRQYPVFGRFSRLIEEQRHVLQENLLLNREDGKPFNWVQKEIVYKRAADKNKSQPFGSQFLYSESGHEWFLHSVFPAKEVKDDLRVEIGGVFCKKPYSASILNIGGMSYGSISKNATLAFNGGAKQGGFAQNTGEGGLTPFHEEFGADLIFQFGTGYFGCRDENGSFSEERFTNIAQKQNVKMVEVKISQGAKPGFGAILPAKKNTPEIANYRKVEAHTEIHSPAYHSSFSNTKELTLFINKLRELSEGKPIGIKLCMGSKIEFENMIETFQQLGTYPDFITVDGAEGGSGAAHMEALHWVGTPLEEALNFAHKILLKYNLRNEIKLLAAGKIISAFDIAKSIVLGADACYSARGMMFALGCVQSLKCNLDTCPTGITTMIPSRVASLVVEDKKKKVANYHRNTLEAFKTLMAAAGVTHRNQLSKSMIQKRTNENSIQSYKEIFNDL